MTERTEEMINKQKRYYNEKCKTNEAFIIKRNTYNNKYYEEHSADPKWREKRNEYYRKLYKKNYKKNMEKKRLEKENDKRQKLLLNQNLSP